MNKFISVLLFISFSTSWLQAQTDVKSLKGFFPFEWNEDQGKIRLLVDKIDHDFLYVNSLAAGLGSNDIGLDRGQLGDTRIVKFIRSGNKLLLVQPNLKYRAISTNTAEINAVEEAFAQSVIWGFTIEETREDGIIVDFTPFLLRDAHDVIGRLNSRNQGTYSLDESRSAIWMDRTKNFPKNTEFEAILTFKGTANGDFIRSVTPDPNAVTVRQHHSFIELPDDEYSPRIFKPSSGFFNVSFYDYAAPIHEDMEIKYIVRHRLTKKNPSAKVSEAVKPIIYYLDPGCPEPVRSALLDGAGWWNQAFESAGYKDAFQVKVLPSDADPLDVRYNVIQWVHRSTRGWSYGASVVDPRSGEIIKGHVSLGSLRVRQDFMIAQGILSPYDDKENHKLMEEMALARLRQLSAHEVGHTIGLAHNFAASYNDRASVMDYPHPYITSKGKNFNLSEAYDDKIGSWDKRTVLYGYQDFEDGVDEKKELLKIIRENEKKGFLFISDDDARPVSGAHPFAHLWDNGESAVDELNRLRKLRKEALRGFGTKSISNGTPYSRLENVFVPVYLMHRYQIEAVAKLIGGYNYNYAEKNKDSKPLNEAVSTEIQETAFMALLEVVKPSELEISEEIRQLLLPPAFGFDRNRESFNGQTGVVFDPLSAAEGLATHTFDFLLNAERLNRMYIDPTCSPKGQGLDSYFSRMSGSLLSMPVESEYQESIKESVFAVYIHKMIHLLDNSQAFQGVKSTVLNQIEQILNPMDRELTNAERYLSLVWARWLNGDLEKEKSRETKLPPGSPIGCGSHF